MKKGELVEQIVAALLAELPAGAGGDTRKAAFVDAFLQELRRVRDGLNEEAAQRRVIIPDSVILVGAGAFVGCKALKHITLPRSLASISGNTFEGCGSLSCKVQMFVGDQNPFLGWILWRLCL